MAKSAFWEGGATWLLPVLGLEGRGVHCPMPNLTWHIFYMLRPGECDSCSRVLTLIPCLGLWLGREGRPSALESPMDFLQGISGCACSSENHLHYQAPPFTHTQTARMVGNTCERGTSFICRFLAGSWKRKLEADGRGDGGGGVGGGVAWNRQQKEKAWSLIYLICKRFQAGQVELSSKGSSSVKTKAAAVKVPSHAGCALACPWAGIPAPCSQPPAFCLLFILFLIFPESCLYFWKERWNWIFFKSGFLRKQFVCDISRSCPWLFNLLISHSWDRECDLNDGKFL